MDVDFDQILDRRGTNSIAVDAFREYLLEDYPDLTLPCPDSEAISMWVADMAFATPTVVRQAMANRLEHPIFGYTVLADDEFYRAYADWCVAHYRWEPEREHFFTTPGVVPALYSLVDYFVGEGQKVMTLTPAYGFFKTPVEDRNRQFLSCGMQADDAGGYTIDFDEFEQMVTDPAMRMFFLCHPHNPTGRIWTEPELRRMAELCFHNDVIVVSDEIHCDLLRTGLHHTPLAQLFPEEERLITCMSASKTFNLAGLGLSQIVIPGEELREIWSDRSSPVVNPISVAGTVAALCHGEPWRAELLRYIDGNFNQMADTLAAELPGSRFHVPDATYLGWVDLSAYFAPEEDLTRFFAEKAGVLVEGADMFVANGEGHVRVNVACPRSTLTEGLDRMIQAVPGR
jgi:cystathionine beta-lyase